MTKQAARRTKKIPDELQSDITFAKTLPSRLSLLRRLSSKTLRAVESLNELLSLTAEPDFKSGRARPIKLKDEVSKFEATLIRLALKRTDGNQRRAAQFLGVKNTTLHSKIQKYGDAVLPVRNQNEHSKRRKHVKRRRS